MVAGGKKYQISIQVVEIGSKPKEEPKKSFSYFLFYGAITAFSIMISLSGLSFRPVFAFEI
jgi:hypothetical protein